MGFLKQHWFVIMCIKSIYRHDETTIVKTTVNATKEAVTEKLNDCKKWHSVHCVSVLLSLSLFLILEVLSFVCFNLQIL